MCVAWNRIKYYFLGVRSHTMHGFLSRWSKSRATDLRGICLCVCMCVCACVCLSFSGGDGIVAMVEVVEVVVECVDNVRKYTYMCTFIPPATLVSSVHRSTDATTNRLLVRWRSSPPARRITNADDVRIYTGTGWFTEHARPRLFISIITH